MNELTLNVKTGFESLTYEGKETNAKLLDFWRWMGSDLLSNSFRGIFAEYIVGLNLDIINDIRMEWAPYDLTYNGLNIEVKSSAYIQSWKQNAFSKINFSIKPASIWNSVTNKYNTTKSRTSHFYVFGVLDCKDSSIINPLILDQWDFYVLPTYLLDKYVGGQKTITLISLKKLPVSKVKYSSIKSCIDGLFEKDSLNILSNFGREQ